VQEHQVLITDLFQVGVPVLEKIIRPILVYFFLVLVLRLAGKRELGQINTFDLVVLLTLSNTVQNAIIGHDDSLSGGLIGATTLLMVNGLVVRFLYGHPRLSKLLEGSPDVLMENGKLREARLKKEGITIHELEAAAHRQGYTSLKAVDKAILEAGGGISFFAKLPTDETVRHQELVEYLKSLEEEMTRLRESLLRPKNE
jgi:uncharacterized membrane protein YcaP (DUF421 family)